MIKEKFSNVTAKKVSIKSVLICFVLFFIVVILCICCFFVASCVNKNNKKVENFGIVFQNIVQHATQEADVKGIYPITDDRKLFGISIPFTESAEVLVAPVRIKAGYNKDDIKYEFNPISKKIIVTIPDAQILDKYIIKEKCYDLYTHDNPFSTISSTTFREAELKIEEECMNEAIDNGLLREAKENAEAMVRDLKSNYDPENEYELVFK